MKINPRFALVGIACLTLNMACGSKTDKTSLAQGTPTNKVESRNEVKTADLPKEEPLDFAEAPTADSGDLSDGIMGTPASAAMPAEPVAEQAQSPAILESQKTVTTTPAQTNVTLAADSDEIKNTAAVKISFADLNGLLEISQMKNSAIHRQMEFQSQDSEIIAQLKKMNEENMCRVHINGKFHEKDYLLLANHERNPIDKAEDIYKSELTFKNANGEIRFTCLHTTPNFFVEDFYINLQKWITVYNMEETPLNIKDYVSPRTENRLLNAIKIANLEKFEKIIMSDDRKELYSLFNGDVVDMDAASGEVANKDGLMSCSVPYVVGTLSKDQVFIRVEKGIAEETPAEMKTGTIFAIYRADAENFFAITCLSKKTSTWLDFMKIAKGIISFGVMERPEYSKKYDEVIEIHKEFKAKK